MSVLLPTKPIRVQQPGQLPAQGLLVGDTGVVVVDGNNPSVSLQINNSTAVVLDKFRRLGINVDTPLTFRLEVLDPDGDCIKIGTHSKFASFKVDPSGVLQLDADSVNIPNEFRLHGDVVHTTAKQLNFINVDTAGVAQQNRAMVLDSTRSIYGVNTMAVNNLQINRSFTMDTNADEYALSINNSMGKCLRLRNDNWSTTFTIAEDGSLYLNTNGDTVDIFCDANGSFITYPLQLTSDNMGIGIKFNTFNSMNIKRNVSSIETVILSNENNMENSIIKFNNMRDGDLMNTVTIRNDGYIICNTVMELSDARRKQILNTSNTRKALETVCKVKTYDFIYKDDPSETPHKGVMAQELRTVIPSAVNVGDEYTVSNKELIGYLLDSVKELASQVKKMKAAMADANMDVFF
jgi:hypothetical protein